MKGLLVRSEFYLQSFFARSSFGGSVCFMLPVMVRWCLAYIVDLTAAKGVASPPPPMAV